MIDEMDHVMTVAGVRYITMDLAVERWGRKARTIDQWLREDDRISRKLFGMGRWWVPEVDVKEAFLKRVKDQRIARLTRKMTTRRGT